MMDGLLSTGLPYLFFLDKTVFGPNQVCQKYGHICPIYDQMCPIKTMYNSNMAVFDINTTVFISNKTKKMSCWF